ncbi:MAG: AI-2E family transporter [Muribaculaceae bacterium]|nr:AI-2E family transporter [Muribaculaceae bacterium]
MNRRPYTFDRVVRILFVVCGLVAILFLLDLLSDVLLPFLVACLIAYVLEPSVEFNKKILGCKRRFFPVVMTLLEALFLVGMLCWILIPYLVDECAEMGTLIKEYASSQIQIPYISKEIHDFIRKNVDFDQIGKLLSREQWIELIKNSLNQTWSFIGSSLSLIVGIISWLIVVLYVIFIMLDYERFILSMRQLVPYGQRRQVFHIVKDIENVMNRYFRGQFYIASLVGLLFAAGFLIIGLPMAVLFGLFIGMLNMVPYLQMISLPIAAFLCLVGSISGGPDFWVLFGECMAVYVVVQCIQDLVLTPKIMGKAMGLNPAIILLALSVWGTLLGFLGMIIALPLTTLLLSYYDMYIVRRSYPDDAEESEEPEQLEERGGDTE